MLNTQKQKNGQILKTRNFISILDHIGLCQNRKHCQNKCFPKTNVCLNGVRNISHKKLYEQ